jgi:hypothetical protein
MRFVSLALTFNIREPVTLTGSSDTQSFFGAMGCALAIILTTFGAAYGTAKSAIAIFSSGVIRPDRLMQNTFVFFNLQRSRSMQD